MGLFLYHPFCVWSNPLPSSSLMTTTSPANSTRKFSKRLKATTSSRSAFAPVPANCDDRELDHMKLIREEIFKEASIGTNGALNEKMGVRYKECRKNHAASIGGYAVDGCREFMPAGEEGTAAAFKCAACSCHRNFHRKELETNEYCCCDCSSISATAK